MTYQLLLQISISIMLFFGFGIVKKIIVALVRRSAHRLKIDAGRSVYVLKTLSMGLVIVWCVLFAIVWGINFRGLMIVTTSFFAVLGVALFASWSVLSNITAGLIMFFSFPYRIHDRIRIIDGEHSITGVIFDMSLFHIELKTETGERVYYPNNVAIQKPIVKLRVHAPLPVTIDNIEPLQKTGLRPDEA